MSSVMSSRRDAPCQPPPLGRQSRTARTGQRSGPPAVSLTAPKLRNYHGHRAGRSFGIERDCHGGSAGGNHGQSASPQPRMPPADPTTRQPRPRSVSPKCSHAIRGESRCPPVVYRSHTASSPPRRTVRSTVPASPVSEGIDHRTFVTAVRTVVLRSGARRKCPTLTATRGTL